MLGFQESGRAGKLSSQDQQLVRGLGDTQPGVPIERKRSREQRIGLTIGKTPVSRSDQLDHVSASALDPHPTARQPLEPLFPQSRLDRWAIAFSRQQVVITSGRWKRTYYQHAAGRRRIDDP